MERGSIKFIYEDGKTPFIKAQLVNGNIWITKWEIARFFNVFSQKIEMNLRSIFKEHLLWEEDCSCTYRYTENGIEKQIVYYNLEVLIFLSYRINTLESKVFRQFVGAALREHLEKDEKPKKNMKTAWLYNPQFNYMLN
jgi:hypothetical protein